MAKLENVKILDMVNGEPTRVEYDGEVYVKTEDNAEAGDLVRVIDEDISDVEIGGFYKVYKDADGDLYFNDNVEDKRDCGFWADELETFRKVSETKASADLAERLAELERRLEALEERTGAKEGERQARRLTVGDYARVVANDSGHDANIGDIVKIVEDEHDYHPYRCENLAGEDVMWFKEHELEPVTDEEVRWAKIGRKPGEFKKGDIVRLLEDSGAHEAGTLVEVHDNGNYKADDSVWVGEFDWYELVVPVEQRFDFADAEGARQ
jgi:hypothetical protein